MANGLSSHSRNGEVEVAFASQKQYLSPYVLRADVLQAHRDQLAVAEMVRFTDGHAGDETAEVDTERWTRDLCEGGDHRKSWWCNPAGWLRRRLRCVAVRTSDPLFLSGLLRAQLRKQGVHGVRAGLLARQASSRNGRRVAGLAALLTCQVPSLHVRLRIPREHRFCDRHDHHRRQL
jgi:hypothetical protein